MSRLTFGEGIEVSSIKDEILHEVENFGQYSSVFITIKLRKIAKISKAEADKAIKECGLDKIGWKVQN